MKTTLIQAPIAFLLITFVAEIPVVADDHLGARPPEGFSALFNGKDLKGWWGIGTEDPAKWMALSPEKLAEKKAKSLLDIRKHWSVENEELVNDGNGLYLSTEKHYGDFELLLEYKTVPRLIVESTSGVFRRFRSGTTPRRGESGILEPTRVQEVSGTIPRVGPGRIHLCSLISPLESGTASVSS